MTEPTPKQKAEELLEKFTEAIVENTYVEEPGVVKPEGWVDGQKEAARECALISLNMLIEETFIAGSDKTITDIVKFPPDFNIRCLANDYWYEVREEIKKLKP